MVREDAALASSLDALATTRFGVQPTALFDTKPHNSSLGALWKHRLTNCIDAVIRSQMVN